MAFTTNSSEKNMSDISNLYDLNVTNSTNSTTYWDTPVKVIMATFLSIFMVCAIVGNSMVISIIIRHRGMRTRTNMFLASLAVADLLVAIMDMPFSLVTLIMDDWIFGSEFCSFNGFTMPLFLITSIHTLMYISIHKYITITRPFSRILTFRRVLIMISAAWIWAGVCATTTVTGLTFVEYKPGTTQCGPAYPSQIKQFIQSGLITFTAYIIPLSIMILSYARMFWEIRGYSKRLREYSNQEKGVVLRQQKRITLTLFIVVAIFLLCWTPYVTYATYAASLKDKSKIPKYINGVVYWFGYMNSACNPIVYALRSPSFREGYKEILCQGPAYISDDMLDTVREESPNPLRRLRTFVRSSFRSTPNTRHNSFSVGSRRFSSYSQRRSASFMPRTMSNHSLHKFIMESAKAQANKNIRKIGMSYSDQKLNLCGPSDSKRPSPIYYPSQTRQEDIANRLANSALSSEQNSRRNSNDSSGSDHKDVPNSGLYNNKSGNASDVDDNQGINERKMTCSCRSRNISGVCSLGGRQIRSKVNSVDAKLDKNNEDASEETVKLLDNECGACQNWCSHCKVMCENCNKEINSENVCSNCNRGLDNDDVKSHLLTSHDLCHHSRNDGNFNSNRLSVDIPVPPSPAIVIDDSGLESCDSNSEQNTTIAINNISKSELCLLEKSADSGPQLFIFDDYIRKVFKSEALLDSDNSGESINVNKEKELLTVEHKNEKRERLPSIEHLDKQPVMRTVSDSLVARKQQRSKKQDPLSHHPRRNWLIKMPKSLDGDKKMQWCRSFEDSDQELDLSLECLTNDRSTKREKKRNTEGADKSQSLDRKSGRKRGLFKKQKSLDKTDKYESKVFGENNELSTSNSVEQLDMPITGGKSPRNSFKSSGKKSPRNSGKSKKLGIIGKLWKSSNKSVDNEPEVTDTFDKSANMLETSATKLQDKDYDMFLRKPIDDGNFEQTKETVI